MNNLDSIEVYLERRSSRTFVGKLSKKDNFFIFEYDKSYAYADISIPVGPDLPITKRVHKSETLFPSFADRIPSKRNPAYIEYCELFGISPAEKNELILLSTIGKRGPSSFVFEGLAEKSYNSLDYTNFKNDLGLTLRDFSSIFNISLSSLQNLEKNHLSGTEVLKRIEIYDKFPEVALFELERNGKLIHSMKRERLEEILISKLKHINKKKK